MPGSETKVGVGEFRQRASELIRMVEEGFARVVITRRGEPVAELRAVESRTPDLIGSVTVVEGVDLTEPVVDPSEWQAT